MFHKVSSLGADQDQWISCNICNLLFWRWFTVLDLFNFVVLLYVQSRYFFSENRSFYSDMFVLKGRAVSSWFLNRLVLLGFRLRVGTHVQWWIGVRKPPSCRGLQAAAGRALRHLPEPQQEAAAVSEKNGHWYGKSEHESTPSMYCNARPFRAY